MSGVVFEKEMSTKKRDVRGVIDRNDDFWKEYATAITGEELRQRMYRKIDAWKWNGK